MSNDRNGSARWRSRHPAAQFEHAIAMLTGQQMAVSGGLIQALAGGWDAS
jgi:hypothetical protein